MAGLFERALRLGEGRHFRRLQHLTRAVNALEVNFETLTDEELRGETELLRGRHADGESLNDLLPEAFAAVREASRRTLGMRHFDVQVMGGVNLHLGNISEMKTGEGKTLVATLPAYLNAITSRGVHIVTVNDYLANYQSELMGRVFRALGMTTGVVVAGQTPEVRRAQYACDVTYGTNNEFGFDYLRDNMAVRALDMVQRGHHYAIVDEVDSILIDEARTPLIISGPADEATNAWFAVFATLAKTFVPKVDFDFDEVKKTVGVLEPGIEKVEDYLGIDNLYQAENTPLISFLHNAIKARTLFTKDKDYVVVDGQVLIVDEHTGRVLASRRYSEGVHQALEAKEGVEIKAEDQTLASVTLQNYFRLYTKLSGMTGTAETEAAEFNSIYKLGVVSIPTNKAMKRVDQSDLIYMNEETKFRHVVQDIAARHALGQPILVGTTSVAKSEYLSNLLSESGVPHEVLNAKNHAREAAIIAQAGRLGAVTVATNMAGRGTDIMLGGNTEHLATTRMHENGFDPVDAPAEYEAAWDAVLDTIKAEVRDEAAQVVEAGGLYVLGTERHESRRIDNQLRGRSGRQGDPGESRFYLSMADDLMRMFNAGAAETLMSKSGMAGDMAIESKLVSRSIRSAQSQVEGRNAEVRSNVLKYDDVLNRQRETIYGDRRHILEGDDLHLRTQKFLAEVIDEVLAEFAGTGNGDDWDTDALWAALRGVYPVGITLDELIEDSGGLGKISQAILAKEIHSDALHAYGRREEQLSAPVMREVERHIVLSVIDRLWREHLYEMDYLKEGIGLRAMAQRDPLIEYQKEGFEMFQSMTGQIRQESVQMLFTMNVQVTEAPTEEELVTIDHQAAHAAAVAAMEAAELADNPESPLEIEPADAAEERAA